MKQVNEIVNEIEEAGFEGAVAIATEAEVQAGAAPADRCAWLQKH
jgi:hypothetical protein